MKAFIDDFKLIRVESFDYIDDIKIPNYQLTWYKNDGINQYFKVNKDLILNEAEFIYINNQKYYLEIGLITLRKSFDKRFRYDGPLGYLYHKEFTEFFIFSPVAKEIILVVNNIEYQMVYHNPIWYHKVMGDLEGLNYYYKVRLSKDFKTANCPYNPASNYDQAIIIDKNKLYQQKEDFVNLNKYTDALIYEAHVRDLTINLDVK